MIVGTAGHIDHGKTALVRALTGVDTDRLPEEKKRGISIELGYAYLDTGAGEERIGFIDVPGHEKLVAAMISGATGIDFALLLVAADDGVMPQTREHLAVLSLLGVGRGAVVITKADRAGAERIAQVRAEVQALVDGTPLEGAPVAVVSVVSGDGIEALRRLLVEAARRREGDASRDDAGAAFRLAIDRVFTLAGTGTVVTGTAHAGRVAVGDTLALVPAEPAMRLRVRSIHAQNAAVAVASVGQRVALGLAGIEREAVERGQWLVDPAIAISTARLDARLTVWPGETRPLRSGTTVRLHLGAASVPASVAVLDSGSGGVIGSAGAAGTTDEDAPLPRSTADAIASGESGRIQLVLHAPLAAWRGDRFVLRDASASRTLAGGIALDASAPARYRRTPERLAVLDAAELSQAAERFAAAREAAPNGLDLNAWLRNEGRIGIEADGAGGTAGVASDTAAPPLSAEADGARWMLAAPHAAQWQTRLLQALTAYHASHAEQPGPDAARLRRLVAPRMARPLWRAVLEAALKAGEVGQRGAQWFLPQHDAKLSAVEQRIVQKAWPRLLEGGFDPPWVRTLATDLREPEPLVRAALQRAAQRGELHQVVRDLYYPPPTLAGAAERVREIAARDGDVSAAAFRDAIGLGRKRAIQIVEYFDRVGLLRRVGDSHRLRPECELFQEKITA